MKLFIRLGAAALAVLCLTAEARAWLPVVPAGDYQRTCRRCVGNMKTSVMTCQCRRQDGTWVKAAINYRYCCRGVVNLDGRLRCVRPVRGDFRRSCRSCTTRGYTLLCTCPRTGGGWYRATLFCRHCRGSVSFRQGKLVCDRPGPTTR